MKRHGPGSCEVCDMHTAAANRRKNAMRQYVVIIENERGRWAMMVEASTNSSAVDIAMVGREDSTPVLVARLGHPENGGYMVHDVAIERKFTIK